MIRLFHIGILLLFSQISFAQLAEISVDSTHIHLGDSIPSDLRINYLIKVKNTGIKSNLIIDKILTDCGCMVPAWTKVRILPGKTGYIRFTFNPAGLIGKFEKHIYIFSNARTEKLGLRLTGSISSIKKKSSSLHNLSNFFFTDPEEDDSYIEIIPEKNSSAQKWKLKMDSLFKSDKNWKFPKSK